MEAFYPMITVASMALFGWLGWRMGGARNRNPQVWLALGALLPPLLLILKFLPPIQDEPEEDAEAA
jgi:hypothetical protein